MLLLLPAVASAQRPSPAPAVPPDDLSGIRQQLADLKAQQTAIEQDVQAIRALLESALGARGGPHLASVEIKGRPVKGSPAAKVVIVEFTDYQCPYCGAFAAATFPQIDRNYIATGKIRYVVKNLPIESIHPQAFRAAVGALCAGDQGHYWEMHDRLFANQKQLAPARIEAEAAATGIDMTAFRSCLTGTSHDALIRADVDEAARAGVDGTPMFALALADASAETITPAKVIVGAEPYAAFASAIDALLAQAK
ncbi:MAG TPA: DsbA family protein [Vicinamibacterales bacterium]|nr:DsbA family protein [Vicinamibacterales bacterium]